MGAADRGRGPGAVPGDAKRDTGPGDEEEQESTETYARSGLTLKGPETLAEVTGSIAEQVSADEYPPPRPSPDWSSGFVGEVGAQPAFHVGKAEASPPGIVLGLVPADAPHGEVSR